VKDFGDLGKTLLFFSIPTLMILAGLSYFQYPLDQPVRNLLIIPLFMSLFLLIAGYLMKRGTSKYIRSAGWILFALYWSTQINTLYYSEGGDVVNATICGIGVYVLIYFAYKDLTTRAECLPWLAGVGGISGLAYFTMELIPPIKLSLINLVTKHTATLYAFFDGNVRFQGNLIWVGYDYMNNSSPTAEIIFACTAVQSMLLFVGLILPLGKTSWKRKILAITLLILVIYFLNLVRNASVVYLVGYRITDMNIAHNYIGKAGSLIALLILVFLVFRYIPDLYDKILCTLDLYKKEGFLERTLKRAIR